MTKSTASSKRRPVAAARYVLIVRRADSFEMIAVRVSELVIGRDAKCAVVIDDDSISRQHARMRFGDAITVEDLGSRNGTFLGGRRLSENEPRPIGIGEPVMVAEVTIFVQPARDKAAKAATLRDGVVVRDPKMKQLYKVLDVVAMSPLRVLILGETGVGKEVFARTIHDRSSRADKPYLAIDCGALPASVEDELETANGGTVFLHDIGELPLDVQAKLLHVLETGEVGSPARSIDVRVVSATNRDLRAEIAAGRFRQDLHDRIDGTTIALPPLRERLADIEPLARAFVEAIASKLERPAPLLDVDARDALARHSWPGNIGELKAVIERAVEMHEGPGPLRFAFDA